MPELDFKITGIEPGARGLAPLLLFQLEVSNAPAEEAIHAVILQAQIQIEAARRTYSAQEKEKLGDLFGTPERWGQTLRSKLWTQAQTVVRGFTGRTQAALPVACTFDLNVLATKYFYSLAGGEVPLLFLFSGTIFHPGPDGRLQVRQIAWNKECGYRMPVQAWQDLMDCHYPETAWLALHREVFDRLAAYKSQSGLLTWDEALDRLLPEAAPTEAVP
jgi:hypothetical protein